MTDQHKNRGRMLSRAIADIEEKLDSNELKPTLADLVRLLQIEKELNTDEPCEIRVRWVDGDAKDISSKT